MIERSESGAVTVTGDDVFTYRALAIRRGLILKIDTGLDLSRVSCLSTARRCGLTPARTYREALRDVNAWLVERGVTAKWSRKFPRG